MDAETNKKLTELKAILRALLIAEGNNVTTVRKLAYLYKEEEGMFPNYREYGYSTFYDFLNDIPDTCLIKKNRLGEDCVYPVSNEKTAHISSLVSRQKSRIKRSKSMCTFKSRNCYFQQQQRRQSMYNSPSPITSVHVLQAMIDLRNSFAHVRTNGLRKVDVLARVKSQLGERAANYNIHNLNYHLSELFHTIDVKNDFIYFKNDKISSTLPKRPNNSLNVPLNSIHTVSLKLVDPVTNNVVKQANSVRNNSVDLPIKNSVHLNSIKSNSSMYNLLSSSIEKSRYSNVNEPISLKVNKSSVQLPVSNVNCNHIKSDCINGPLSKIDEFKSCINQASSNKNIKENDLVNDIVKFDNVKTNGYREISDLIKERTKIRLENLIKIHPEGIWCTDLPSVYKKEYGIDLEYNELGFHSIIEFVTALPEIFTISEPGDSKKYMILSTKMLHFKDEESKGINQKLTTAALYNIEEPKDIDPIPLKLSEKVSEALIPDGYMNIGDTVDQIQVSSIVSNIDDDYFEAMVSEIFTPSFFWVKLRKNKKSFDKLMNRLGEFYDNINHLQFFKIPQCILQPGLNVACIYSNIWHRAVIKKVKYDGFVVLFFYDYGTVKSYNPHDVYFLHKSFASMPAQAIACGLHYVRPIGSKDWPKNSTDAFINRVWDLPLIASIGALHQENNTMMVSLTDTTDDQVDVHINDWMVENKYAEWGKMVNQNKIPLHKLCAYDEVQLLKLRDQEHKNQLSNYHDTTVNQINLDEESPKVVNYILSCSNASVDEPEEESNIIKIVKENANLMKQTDKTLESAFCFNKTLKDEFNDRNVNIESEAKIDSLANIINNKFTLESHQNSKSTKSNISENNLSQNQFLANKQVNTGDQFMRRDFTFSSVLQYMDDKKYERSVEVNRNYKFTKSEPYMNGYSDEDSSIGSKYISQSNNQNINLANLENKYETTKLHYSKDFAKMNKRESNGSSEIDEDYCSERHSISQIESSSDVKSDSVNPFWYREIVLSEKMERKHLHIFHYENRGWICLDEFTCIFTKLKDSRVLLKLLKVLKYSLTLKTISKNVEPQLFSDLDKSKLNIQCQKNKIESDFVLILMSLKDMLRVLEKLNIVPYKVMNEAALTVKFFKEQAENMLYLKYQNKIMYDALNVVLKYKELKQDILQSNQQ